MRMSEDRIRFLAKQIAEELIKRGLVNYVGSRGVLEANLEKPILDDLLAEEKIDQEVMGMIAKMQSGLVPGSSRWEAAFTQLKSDICKRKNIII